MYNHNPHDKHDWPIDNHNYSAMQCYARTRRILQISAPQIEKYFLKRCNAINIYLINDQNKADKEICLLLRKIS